MRGMLRCVIAASALLRAAQNICQEANERTSTLEFGIPWKALCTAMHSFARRQGIWLTSGTSMRQYHLSPSFFSLLLNKLLPVFYPSVFPLPLCKEVLPLARVVMQGSDELVNFAVREANRQKQQPRMSNITKIRKTHVIQQTLCQK